MAIKKLDIAVIGEVINVYSGARAVLDLAVAFVKRGHTVTFYATHQFLDPKAFTYLQKSGVKVEVIRYPSIPIVGRWIGCIKLWYLLQKSTHDILQTQVFLSFFIAAYLSGKKITTHYCGTQWNIFAEKTVPHSLAYYATRPLDWLLNLIIYAQTLPIVYLSHQVAGNSQYCAKECKQLYGRSAETVYLSSGSSLIPSKKKYKKNRQFTILSVSRITPYKGFHKLIQVFKEFRRNYPNSRLVIAGSMVQPSYYNYLISLADNHTKIVVQPNDTTLSKLYQSASLYVSFDYYLFFGMPALEAARFQIPLLILNRCAANEIVVNNQNGYVFNTEAELLAELSSLYKHKELRKKLGTKAKKMAAVFNWKNTARTYEQVFYKLL